MIQYPLHFTSHSESPSGMATHWKAIASELPVCSVAIPPEFDGPGGAHSPEDLFNLALGNCFIATFKVYAQMSKLEFTKVSVDTHLSVDVDDAKRPVMKSAELRVKIEGASDARKAQLLADKASRSGFILNSVKTALTFSFEIT